MIFFLLASCNYNLTLLSFPISSRKGVRKGAPNLQGFNDKLALHSTAGAGPDSGRAAPRSDLLQFSGVEAELAPTSMEEPSSVHAQGG